MLSDPARTGVVAVARPEEMPVNEALALEDSLRDEAGMTVDLIVANGLEPARFSAAEAEALRVAPDGVGGAEIRAALRAHRRAKVQRAQLRRLRRGARAPVATLPFDPDGPLDLPGLDALSLELERSL
jgi:anion-transporting  ArsA/GET3 family ATPase